MLKINHWQICCWDANSPTGRRICTHAVARL